MIEHDPFGIEDPYRPAATERFPRRPQPQQEVQIGFRTDPGAKRAWVSHEHDGGTDRIEAVPLGEGSWVARLAPVGTGQHQYVIDADDQRSEQFSFEVGQWQRADTYLGVSAGPAGTELWLGAGSGGVLRLQLSVLAGTTLEVACLHAAGTIGEPEPEQEFSDDGLEFHVDPVELQLKVRRAGHSDWQVSQPLGVRWLMLADGSVAAFELPLSYSADEHLYGLGERFGSHGLRGKRLDTRVYEEYKEQGDRTYLPVPMFLSSRAWGLWLQEDEPALFEFGAEQGLISAEVRPRTGQLMKFSLYLADSPYGVTSLFTKQTGQIEVPPEWAFGPWMSANTWNSQQLAEQAVQRTLDEGVPATVIVIEAWSDESTFYIFNDAEYEPRSGDFAPTLSDFTFTGRWPDPKGFIDWCHENGIRVILWQIPVLKNVLEEHQQHQSDRAWAIDHGLLIRNSDGTPYRNKGWWFPEAEIIDFTNPTARDWWFGKRNYLFRELGIDGMKTDGGEHLWGSDLQAHDGQRGSSLVNTYAREYSRAYYDFTIRETGGDGLVFSRAGYTGAQTSPGHWAGDEGSTWAAYRASIRAGISAGMAGVSIWGWDLGGFSGEVPTPELYLRSTAMAALCPVMQYHSESHGSQDDRERTPWNIAERMDDPAALDIYRQFALLRMRLKDWLHGEAVALAEAGLPLLRVAWLEFPDEHDRLRADGFSYLLGRDLLVAPVVEKSQLVRPVALPAGDWFDAWSGARMQGGSTVQVPVPLDRIPVFIRADSPRAELIIRIFGEK